MTLTIDAAIIVALIALISAIATALISKFVSSILERSSANKEDSSAAAALAEAAATQVKTYTDQFINPLNDRIEGLERENAHLRVLLTQCTTQHEALRRQSGEQIEALQVRVRELNSSLNSQRDQITILIEQAAAKDRTIKQMQAEIDQLRQENELLRIKVEKLQSENEALRTRPIGE